MPAETWLSHLGRKALSAIQILIIPGQGHEGIEQFHSRPPISPAPGHFNFVVGALHGAVADRGVAEAIFHGLKVLR